MKREKIKITRVLKNYYKIHQDPLVGIFVDEYLMRKINKVLHKYRQEILAILENNRQHILNGNWGLCYPKRKQTVFHNYEPIKENEKIRLPKLITQKVENIYNIQGRSIYDKEVEKEVKKLIEKELK